MSAKKSQRVFPRIATLLTGACLWLMPATVWGQSNDRPVRIACIGNSITYGLTIPDRETSSYPSILQRMLGEGYEVGNFGHSGSTLMRKGHRPYSKTDDFKNALNFKPDVALIHLGTNDTDPRDWPQFGDEFLNDYLWLIDTLRTINPNMRIVVANIAPIGAGHKRFQTGTREWLVKEREVIEMLPSLRNVEEIDFYTPLLDHQNLLHDNVHPNAEGARRLAEYSYGAITGNWGGLVLPEVISDGMVLPHNRWFTLRGRADANKPISLTINGKNYETKSDNRGDWSVEIQPLPTGGPYVMTVTDSSKTIKVNDIMAGEVWLAAGQSNMEFRLKQASDTPADIRPDGLLRVFRRSDRSRPDNIVTPRDIQKLIDNNDYYLPAKWDLPDPEFSAVAWNFGRTLVDSLQVPVGIISIPVGGAGTESFIDIETLQDNMPGVLVDWLGNDYLQPWVQQRAKKNMGENGQRHAYEPSYLFSAGVRPLAKYPINGVIWYQGESNAHNTELHERYFRLLTESWRKEFGNKELPFIFVQLSSIERPSWPLFRDSQRRLAQELDNVWMGVSSDLGDPKDVHPTKKAPVGKRLGRLALHNLYGYTNLTPAGPEPAKAMIWPDGSIRLVMNYGQGMTSSDGQPLRTFEIAEVDGLWQPANVSISNDTIILSNSMLTSPRFVRYGWQPFTTANLVNSDSIPASTFKVEALPVEPGIENGVSAAFAGIVNGVPVIAAGCNFPVPDPLAPTAKKVYYQGIYNMETGKRLGSLPKATAYGVAATTPLGVVMAGGEGLDEAALITLNTTGEAVMTALPSLPAKIDNAAATAIGNVVYVAGGNVNGAPSNQIWSLDLADVDGGWKELPKMPGEPRVQPVMTAVDGKVYIFGGFCPSNNGKGPSMSTDGLVFNPVNETYSVVSGPTDGKKSLGLAGGCAVAFDGKIIATGGVNRDVFLNALRKQASDYLLHPIEWYKFNGKVCIFDPETSTWTYGTESPRYARAGASMVVTPEGKILIAGGELKPRIRTAEVTEVIL